jgi:hypothetical protein
MNDTDTLKILSTPGAVALAILWMHSRLKSLEQRMDLLAVHVGAPRPEQKKSRVRSALLLGLGISALIIFGTGCEGMYQQMVPAQPAHTNQVQMIETLPNGQTQLVTNAVVVPAVPAHYEYKPIVTSSIGTAQTVAGFLPPPYGTVAGIALTAVSGILGFVLKRKNGQLNTTQTILNSVITGVEAVGDATTKLSIQSHAAAAGVQQHLEPIVQAVVTNSPGAIIEPAKA